MSPKPRAEFREKTRASLIACALLLFASQAWGQDGRERQAYEEVFYPSGKLRIQAYVYKPAGEGPFPVVIYNHGSRSTGERVPMPFVYVGSMLAASDYLVLVPERRGYGLSDGPTFREVVGEDRGPRFVTRVQEETDDVLAAAEFVKTLPYADATRIGVMGWSFGGIVSVFAASRSSTFRVVVDQAGAALTWNRSPSMQQALTDAAGHIRVPLLGMVAENDQTTESVKAVVKETGKRKAPVKLIVYPRFTPRENPSHVAPGHMIFAAEGAHIWETDLKEFLAQYLGKR